MVSRPLSLILGTALAWTLVSCAGCAGARSGPREGEPSAVQALVLSAEMADSEGRLDDAAASLERALRLDPGDTDLWTRLAGVRLRQGRPEQAESLALKATTLAGDDARRRRAAWMLVADARAARGDDAGAEAARDRATR